MDKFWLQLPVWQQQNVTATWIEGERLQCSQVTYKYIWKPFSKALVPQNRNKAGKEIMRAHRIFNTLFNLRSTDLANSGHIGSSKPGFNCPAALGNLQGGAAHKTHTQSISHTHPTKSQRCSEPLPHHGCRSWIRADLLHKQVDIVHILLNGQILASTTCMAAIKRDSNVD